MNFPVIIPAEGGWYWQTGNGEQLRVLGWIVTSLEEAPKALVTDRPPVGGPFVFYGDK